MTWGLQICLFKANLKLRDWFTVIKNVVVGVDDDKLIN